RDLLKQKKYEEAIERLEAALALDADNEKVRAALDEARRAADKRKKAVERALAAARDLLKQKKYEEAIRELEKALALDAGNKEVRDAPAEPLRPKKENPDDYEARLAAARAALKDEDFVAALREAQAALRLAPRDDEASKLVKEANAGLDNLADEKKRQDAGNQLLEQARVAQKAARYNEAIQAINGALRISPKDEKARRMLGAVEQAFAFVRIQNKNWLVQAEVDRKAGRLDSARKQCALAVKYWPEDEDAK